MLILLLQFLTRYPHLFHQFIDERFNLYMDASPAPKGSESIRLGPWNGHICPCLYMANTNQVHRDK